MRISSILVAFSLALSGCAAKTAPDARSDARAEAPQVGYVPIGAHTCYAAPSLEGLSQTDLRHTRRQGLSEAQAHWRGEIDPELAFADITLAELEDRALIHPEDLGATLTQNFDLCRSWAQGEIDAKTYEARLVAFVRGFDEGRCEPQLYNPYAQNLLVNVGWQGDLKLCAGQQIIIKVSEGRFTLKAPQAGAEISDVETRWITAAGDAEASLEGGNYPCTQEGCLPGMIIGRFTPEEGEPFLFPIGLGTEFEAPAHGDLSIRINDEDYGDNRYFEQNQVLDFLVLEITTLK